MLNGLIPTCKCGCRQEIKIDNYKFNEYLVGHTGGGNWQTKYKNNPEKLNAIKQKLSDSGLEHYAKFGTRPNTEEQKLKASERMKLLLANDEERNRRNSKMIETKKMQSERGILSDKHFTKRKTVTEVEDIYKRIGNKSKETKKNKPTPAWNKNLLSDDIRVKKYSGENHYRFNKTARIKYDSIFNDKLYRQFLLDIQDNVCFSCKDSENTKMVLHHCNENKLDNTFENLIWVCRSCHMRIHNTTNFIKEFEKMVLDFKNMYKSKNFNYKNNSLKEETNI